MKHDVAAIILAAGKGTRMKSDIPKVLHTVCARPMLEYVLELVQKARIGVTVTVLGHGQEEVRKVIPAGTKIAIQKKLLGTADAVKVALGQLKNFEGTVLILYGDIPLLTKETLLGLLRRHRDYGSSATILTAKLENPFGYGRILRDEYSGICGIVEEKDADEFQKDIKEINTGIICFQKDKLASALTQVKPNNRKKEFYLTDVIAILHKRGYLIDSWEIKDINETMGVNSREDLSRANRFMQRRINEALMRQGITIVDPDSAFISFDAKIGQDTVIYPFTVIEKNVKIGKSCNIGPFVRIRSGTRLDHNVSVGNFLEISRSYVGPRTVAKHFGYIGDTIIGSGVNIGAGTVTANYDGKEKNKTRIKDHAFIGSDSVLVAPVTIGNRAKTGAGAVITKHTCVSDGTTVVGVPARPLIREKNV